MNKILGIFKVNGDTLVIEYIDTTYIAKLVDVRMVGVGDTVLKAVANLMRRLSDFSCEINDVYWSEDMRRLNNSTISCG